MGHIRRPQTPCCHRWPSHHYSLLYNSMERRKAAWEQRAGRLFSKLSNHPAKTGCSPRAPLVPSCSTCRAVGRQSSPGHLTARAAEGYTLLQPLPRKVCKCAPPLHIHWKCKHAPSPMLRSSATPTKKGNIQAHHMAYEQSALCSYKPYPIWLLLPHAQLTSYCPINQVVYFSEHGICVSLLAR